MSRTDRHRPMWVQQRDPWTRADFYEQHDHRRGRCDLEKWIAEPWLAWSQTSCRLAFCGHRQICGCRMCTAYWWRKSERRKVRHRHQALCRALVKDPGSEEYLMARCLRPTW